MHMRSLCTSSWIVAWRPRLCGVLKLSYLSLFAKLCNVLLYPIIYLSCYNSRADCLSVRFIMPKIHKWSGYFIWFVCPYGALMKYLQFMLLPQKFYSGVELITNIDIIQMGRACVFNFNGRWWKRAESYYNFTCDFTFQPTIPCSAEAAPSRSATATSKGSGCLHKWKFNRPQSGNWILCRELYK